MRITIILILFCLGAVKSGRLMALAISGQGIHRESIS